MSTLGYRKFFFFTIFILRLSLNISIGQTAPSGIQFLPGDFQTVLTKAKALNKPLFVEVYLTGCPHCEALAPILSEKEVGDFYNKNFVSWKIEANSKESIAFQKLKNVSYPEFPVLFFFDPNGELVHLSTPSEHKLKTNFVNEILTIGATALDPAKRTGSYAGRFANGERELMFLINYGKHCKTIKDQASLDKVNDALGKTLTTPGDMSSQTGFYVLQRLITDYDNPLSSYFFTHLEEYRAKYPAKDVRDAGEAILYYSLYGSKADSYSLAKILQMRKSMIDLGVAPVDANARFLLKELDAYLREKNTKGAANRFNEYRQSAKNISLPDYAYLMKYFNEKATDNSYLSDMPAWANDGVKAAKPEELNSKSMAGLYYELAEAYRKLGQKEDAKKCAKKALDIAKIAKDDMKRYEQQIANLK